MIITIGIPLFSYAQSFEEEFEQFSNDINSEFEQFLEQNNKAFDEFLISSEKEFMDLLREEWVDISNSGINRRDIDNQPDTITTFYILGSSSGLDRHNIHSVSEQFSKDRKDSESFVFQLEKDNERDYVDIELNLFGDSFNIAVDKSVFELKIQETIPWVIADSYDQMVHTDYSYLLKQIIDINRHINGNDWMQHQIIERASELLSLGSSNKKTFLSWFLLLKAGYKVRLGISENDKIILLVSTSQKVYNSPHYLLDNTIYYALNEKPVQLKTYPNGIVGGRSIDLKIKNSLKLRERLTSKVVKFEFKNKDYDFDVRLNKNLVDYYKTYPTTELNVYQNAPLSYSLVKALRKELLPVVKNMSKGDAQYFLLSLVQRGFPYRSDITSYGKEHFNFPEETLWDNFSDCEDRALLLSALCDELLGLKTALLDYKGHVVVGLPEEQNNEGIMQCRINNRFYTLADPSYLNAPLGVISPSIKDIKPCLLTIMKQDNDPVHLSSTCIIEKKFSLNDNSEVLIAGIFDTCSVQNQIIYPQNQVYETMLVSQSSMVKEEWFLKPEGIYSIQDVVVAENSIFVTGVFNGNLKCQEKELYTDSTSVFMLKLNKKGEINWIKRVDFNKNMFDSTQQTMVFDSLGKMLFTLPAEIDFPQQQVSIYTDKKENIYLNLLSTTLGKPLIDSLSFQTGDAFDIVNWIVMENSRLLKSNFHVETAPIFALVNLLYSGNITLKGNHLVNIIKRSSTKTPKQREVLIANLMGIKQLTRSYDVVKVTTGKETPILLDNLLVADNSIAKVVKQSKGSRIFIYRGVEVRMDNNTHKLNNIFINQYTGEIWYDYDRGYRSKLPVRNIIMN